MDVLDWLAMICRKIYIRDGWRFDYFSCISVEACFARKNTAMAMLFAAVVHHCRIAVAVLTASLEGVPIAVGEAVRTAIAVAVLNARSSSTCSAGSNA